MKSFDLNKGFYVQKKMCSSCIYKPDSPLDIQELENQIKDQWVFFKGHRQCHHSDEIQPACCRGFWNKHKDEFQGGQLAQRLDAVIEVEVDTLGVNT
jgi:hypothetical protein